MSHNFGGFYDNANKKWQFFFGEPHVVSELYDFLTDAIFVKIPQVSENKTIG